METIQRSGSPQGELLALGGVLAKVALVELRMHKIPRLFSRAVEVEMDRIRLLQGPTLLTTV
ncbi:unannotated protein [freshwater metagenome]|uniref:Unannotated protein n=1 Tax=freshwater metagenome TaxID=449393 RepID=A0A6J6CCA2_9ZZZZ